MVQGIEVDGLRIYEPSVEIAFGDQYDVAVWTAGYEARAGWLVLSKFCPTAGRWYRVEFISNRYDLSAPFNLQISKGEVLGGQPGEPKWDGHWTLVWRDMIRRECELKGRPIRLFVDYSSMPKAVYGSLVLEATRHCRKFLSTLTLAYAPGHHGQELDGSRSIQGIWPLIGTEGRCVHAEEPAFIVGLGYDGVLAEAILELFRVTNFSCLYGSPGVELESAERTRYTNAGVLARSELVATCSAWSPTEAFKTIEWIYRWYEGHRDVIIVPLGPKPHVLASVLFSCAYRSVGLRFPKVLSFRPVQVEVDPSAIPFAVRIEII